MLNEVRIFEALIFYSVLDSNFTNSRPDSYNFSQGDSQGVNFTARSYDLAHSGVVLSLVGGLLAVWFRLYSAQICRLCTDYSGDVASRRCGAGPHIHAGVNIKQLYKNTAALLKALSCICSMQCATCREDVSAAKWEILSALEHLV